MGLGARSESPSLRDSLRNSCLIFNSLLAEKSSPLHSCRSNPRRGRPWIFFRNTRRNRNSARHRRLMVLPCYAHPQHPRHRPAISRSRSSGNFFRCPPRRCLCHLLRPGKTLPSHHSSPHGPPFRTPVTMHVSRDSRRFGRCSKNRPPFRPPSSGLPRLIASGTRSALSSSSSSTCRRSLPYPPFLTLTLPPPSLRFPQ